jgi:hypothetical protein
MTIYVRLFFESGDDYDVRFGRKKENTPGSLGFTYFTSIFPQRGVTLLHDGCNFHTPTLERYLEEEAVVHSSSNFPFSDI